MAEALAALFTTDSGSLTSAELVRRLRVSPASISKAMGYLENQALIKRERDPHSRAERYAIDDLVRSAQRWHKIYATHPPKTSETDD